MPQATAQEKSQSQATSSVKEKVFYGLGDVGSNFIWSFASSFLVLYYTDSAGLTAAYVGTMMLIARILDGASDIGMGVVIEKTKTRWGKARPWVLFGSIPFAISLMLVFNVPSALSESGKNAYAFITYVFMAVFCYTAVNLSYHAMLPRFSMTQHDRAVVSTVRTLMVIAVMLILSNVTPAWLEALGGQRSQGAWTVVSAVYGILAFICLLATFFGVKEKIPATPSSKQADAPSLYQALLILLKTKYFYLAIILTLFVYLMNGIGGVGIYYARDVLGNANYYGILMLVSMVPMFIAMPFVPLMYKKFGKTRSITVGMIVSAVGAAVQLFNPYSLPLAMVSGVIKTAGMVPLSTALFTFAGDIVEYSEWKHGIRTEGFVTGTNSFGMKLGTGLGSALVGWLLAFGKYDASLEIQAQSTLNAEILIQIGIPIISAILCVIVLLFWDIDKHRPEIEKFLAKKAS
ncbi:MAG: glycoside-pentoside-hexuronide (GPH):cation symporter [Clostridiales bacterium]|nr:glycoside-pentoside-hexuronide (GPH):cation symporter [Clostridiales bacterium]